MFKWISTLFTKKDTNVITGGDKDKGGHNSFPSQITERPPAPAATKPAPAKKPAKAATKAKAPAKEKAPTAPKKRGRPKKKAD